MLQKKAHQVWEDVYVGFSGWGAVHRRVKTDKSLLMRLLPSGGFGIRPDFSYANGARISISDVGVVQITEMADSSQFTLGTIGREMTERAVKNMLGSRADGLEGRELYLAALELIPGAENELTPTDDDNKIGFLYVDEKYLVGDKKLEVDFFERDGRFYGRNNNWRGRGSDGFGGPPSVYRNVCCTIEGIGGKSVYLRFETTKYDVDRVGVSKTVEDRGLSLEQGLDLLDRFDAPTELAEKIISLADRLV